MLWLIIKVAVFIALVGAVTLGASFLLELEGGVRVVMAGVEINLTPIKAVIALSVLILAIWLLMRLAGMLVAVLRFINGDETALSRYFDRNRQEEGYRALGEGMLALASGEDLSVEAICTVAGNVQVETCTRNALGLLALTGHTHVPVYSGCARPLQAEPVFAGHIHGESGLGSVVFPEKRPGARPGPAAGFLVKRLSDASQPPVTLVITGPSTNLATALEIAPKITAGIERIVLMGGARREGGNITPSAEFNIHADPHAAQAVLHSGIPATLIGLDATLQLRCTPDRMAALRAIGNPASGAAAEMISHVNAVYGEIYGTAGAALHDPCTIAWLLAPGLFSARPARVEVETGSPLTRGHTAIDLRPASGTPPNADWVDGLDADAVFSLLLERIARL